MYAKRTDGGPDHRPHHAKPSVAPPPVNPAAVDGPVTTTTAPLATSETIGGGDEPDGQVPPASVYVG